ncbi:MAG: DNA polymerase III subunit [Clostridia bacterium]|nr:DNA polymerase III subunit [Clostridia bacterium]
MDFFSTIYGNEKNKAMFSSLIRSKKLSHAYLVSGPEGSGKKTLTLAVMANLALEQNGEDVARRVNSGVCPDVSIVKPDEDKKTTGVDTVREFISRVALSPSELDFKAYIFDKADRLTVQAQNALLKVIEEPPENVYIFLLCDEASSMIKTVRSRVQQVQTERFMPERIYDYFKDRADIVGSERFEFASRLCMGAIGKVSSLISDDEGYRLFVDTFEIVRVQSEKMRKSSYFDFTQAVMKISDNRERLSRALELLLMAYRDIGAMKADPDAETVFFGKKDAEELAERFSYKCIAASTETVSKIKTGVSFNTGVVISGAALACGLWNAV